METKGSFQNGDLQGPEHGKEFKINLYETVGQWREGHLGKDWISAIKTAGREEQVGSTVIVKVRGLSYL